MEVSGNSPIENELNLPNTQQFVTIFVGDCAAWRGLNKMQKRLNPLPEKNYSLSIPKYHNPAQKSMLSS